MRGTNAKTGKRSAGAEHLRQSVTDILNTPIGSRVLRRDYGSELPALIDAPRDGSTRLKIVAATATALARWEPRITVSRVSVSYAGDSCFDVAIEGTEKAGGKSIAIGSVRIYGVNH